MYHKNALFFFLYPLHSTNTNISLWHTAICGLHASAPWVQQQQGALGHPDKWVVWPLWCSNNWRDVRQSPPWEDYPHFGLVLEAVRWASHGTCKTTHFTWLIFTKFVNEDEIAKVTACRTSQKLNFCFWSSKIKDVIRAANMVAWTTVVLLVKQIIFKLN